MKTNFTEQVLKNGTRIWYKDDKIRKGSHVFIRVYGSEILIPDGYWFVDTFYILTKDGKVIDIITQEDHDEKLNQEIKMKKQMIGTYDEMIKNSKKDTIITPYVEPEIYDGSYDKLIKEDFKKKNKQ